mgnify:CR=1 FL=1
MKLTIRLVVCLMLLPLVSIRAQEERAGAGENRIPVDVTGARMIWDGRSEDITFVGNARVELGTMLMTADRITYNRAYETLEAVGNVHFERGDERFDTDRLIYEIRTGEVTSGAYDGYQPPLFIKGLAAERQADETIVLQDGSATTCDLEHPHTSIEARHITIYPGSHLEARNVYFMVGERSVFYLPYYKRSFDDKNSNFSFVPGYSSDFGAFLLSSYRWTISPMLKTTWHVDYRQKRGGGYGLDADYIMPDYTGEGRATGYYTQDDEPQDDEDTEIGQEIDEERFRLTLAHRQSFTPDTYGIVDMTYMSDPDVEEDFFEDDFRRQTQPDNLVNVVKADPKYTLSLLVRPRIHDFYNVVERLPELSFETRRLRLGDSRFYYQNQSSLANLRASFADGSKKEDYDSVRVDTFNQILYPKKYFGFLNIVPRANFRATYYSNTPEYDTETRIITNEVTAVDSPDVFDELQRVMTVSTNEFTSVSDGSGDVRLLYGTGVETYFRGYRTWAHEDNYYNIHGLRHTVEPSANYFLTARPELEPDEIYQFDAIDQLGKQNFIRWGLRNKLQTKRREVPHDLIDFFVYTDWRVDPEKEENEFSDIYFDNELRPSDRIWMDNDWAVTSDDGEIRYFNTYLRYILNRVNFSAGHRYRMDQNNLFSTEVNWAVTHKWGLRAYHRYEADDGELEEQEYTIYRDLHCWDGWFSVRERDGDITLWLVMSLKAFPTVPISLGK